MSQNKDALDTGFALAKKIMAEKIAEILAAKGSEIIPQAYDTMINERQWLGFTGNAQNSMVGIVYSPAGQKRINVNGIASPIGDKIEINDWRWYAQPYEGDSRSVLGQVELETSTASAAIDRVAAMPLPAGKTLGALRLTMAVEYNKFLKNVDNDLTPLDILHAIATVGVMALK